jgi:hypothetical protein
MNQGVTTIGRMDFDKFIRVLKDTVMKWWDDNTLRLSAALSYYTLFSLAPLLTIAVAIAGVVIEEDAVQDELRDQFQGLIGKPGAEAIANMLHPDGRLHGNVQRTSGCVELDLADPGEAQYSATAGAEKSIVIVYSGDWNRISSPRVTHHERHPGWRGKVRPSSHGRPRGLDGTR